MRVVRVNDFFSAGSQPEGDTDWDAIGAAGFRTVLNNRRDGEEAGQPRSADEAAAASRRGLGYEHLPVALPAITEEAVAGFERATAAADGPVFAHCKSGMRSLALWAIAEARAGRLPDDEIPALGARLGVDLRAASAFLAARGAGGRTAGHRP